MMTIAIPHRPEGRGILAQKSDEKENKILGFVHFHKRLDGWTTLHELVVDKNYQKIGIGKELYNCVSYQ